MSTVGRYHMGIGDCDVFDTERQCGVASALPCGTPPR